MDVSTGLASLRAAVELGGLLVNERDRQKAAAIQIDFTNKLTEAQTQLMELLGTVIDQQRLIATLEKRVREMEASKAEKERYVLSKIGTEREFFAYRLRPSAELVERADEVEHFVCHPCFEGGKKVVIHGNGDGYWECPVCKDGAQVTPVTPISRVTRRGRSDLLAGY